MYPLVIPNGRLSRRKVEGCGESLCEDTSVADARICDLRNFHNSQGEGQTSLVLRQAEFAVELSIHLREIGRRIRELRGFDMTQSDFAGRIGVAQSYLSALERGEKEPGAAVLLAISKEFGRSVDWLLTGQTSHFRATSILRNETTGSQRNHYYRRGAAVTFLKPTD